MNPEDEPLVKVSQLTSHIRQALHILNVKALGVTCPSCGSKIGRPCYGNGAMSIPHESRFTAALEEVHRILTQALDERWDRIEIR